MPDLDLCYLTAGEALRRFAAKTLSPVELMKAVIARAEAVEPAINAFTFKYYDEALQKARAAEARWMKGEPLGPLDGIATAVKDESSIAGYPTTNASEILRDFVPETTSPTNERLLEAGMIVHARTATPEFSCAAFTHSRMWGVSRNPWNTAFTPGGSSGGSGAALAAGSTTIATGSDIGGSIRIPASCCGVVGFKPPYGRNPDDPPFSLDFYNHTGPMARSVEDIVLMQNVMAGPHPRDIATVRPKLTLPSSYPGLKDARIAYSIDLGFFAIDPDVRRNTLAALAVLRDAGAVVEEVDLGWDQSCLDGSMHYLGHLFGALMAREAKSHANVMNDYALWFAEQCDKSTTLEFLDSYETAGRMYASLGPLLERYDALICPTTAIASVKADFDVRRDVPILIDGRAVDNPIGWALTPLFNTMSRCPVLSVPTGHAANGVPTGMQIVGKTFEDGDVMRIAMGYEQAVGGFLTSAAKRPKL